MRGGGTPPSVNVYLCYKGQKLSLTQDLERETKVKEKITQRDVAKSIGSLDTRTIIGILFQRTVYEWKFCVFDNEIKKVNIDDDKQDILKAIRALTQDENLEMVIPDTLMMNVMNTDVNRSSLRLFLCSRKSFVPGSNNLVLIDQGLSIGLYNSIDWKDRQKLTVEKKETMAETQVPSDVDDIHFLNLKKIPDYITTSDVLREQKKNCDQQVNPYNSHYINLANSVFDNRDKLCHIPKDILMNVADVITKSRKLLEGNCPP